MPLIKLNLLSNIRSINDQEFIGFNQFPQNSIEAANRWSLAIGNYAAQVIPISSTFEPARMALESQLLLIPTAGESAFIQGLISYANLLALGMAPTFSAIPPPIPPILNPAFTLGFGGGSSEAVANLLSDIIDGWFRTGTAINTISGVTVNWN